MVEYDISLKCFARLLVPALGLTLVSPAYAQMSSTPSTSSTASPTSTQSTPTSNTTLPTLPVVPPVVRPTATAVITQDELFQVDQRNPVGDTSGSFFNGLPLPSLGYSVRASLLSVYDSNYRRAPDNGQPDRSSFRFTPMINGTVNMPLGRQSLYATALIGKDFYTADSAYNRQRLAFSGGANLAAGSSCTGNLSANWVQAQSNPNANINNPNQGFVPNTQTTSSFSASVGCGGISGFTPRFSYRYAKSTNEDIQRAFSDLNSNSYSASLGYARPTLGVISLFGTLSDNSYPNQTIGTFTRGVSITNLGVQYSRSLTSSFSADASLSHVNINPNFPNQPSSGNLGYSLSINYTPPTRFSGSIVASQNASSSPNTGTSLYFVQTAFALNMAYQIQSTLSATLALSTSGREYEDQVGTIINPNQVQSDRFNRFRLALNWTGIRNARTSFYISQQNRNADPSSFNYKDTMVGILLSYGI